MQVSTFSHGIYKIPNLKAFLGASKLSLASNQKSFTINDVIVGWGMKKNTVKAKKIAIQNQLPYLSLEDGFIRSVGLGRAGNASISLVADACGIYYDASKPSDLENLLNGSDDAFDENLIAQAKKAILLILNHHISKYNGQQFAPASLFDSQQKNILIVDQVAGYASLTYGALDFSLEQMVSAAKLENPGARIYVKLHPETVEGFRKGLFSKLEKDADLVFISENYNPISVLKNIDKVYVVTSQLGFEALLMNIPVTCFGMPFYAGWGLTDDRASCARRTKVRTLEEVFAAAYMLYSRYVNPVSGKRCDIFEAIDYIALQNQMDDPNEQKIFCFGIRHWTRVNIKPLLSSSDQKIKFVKSVSAAKKAGIKQGDRIVVWGTRRPDGIERLESITGQQAICMEDGFLRSVGLGSDFTRPSSLVLDSEGIYFDPSKPSNLESLLESSDFSPSLLARAVAIREKLISSQLTKYNLQPNNRLETDAAQSQKIILVPGQVEDDASIRLGCESVNTNLKLIQAVRQSNPNAYIIYKPHPDVSTGNRIGKVHPDTALIYCDQYVDQTGIAACLETANEVHTMTSLVGFEALMRKIPVTVYGMPFYAGWNLTTDKLSISRRHRHLSLDELVAGALLLYPRYYDWDSKSFATCEQTIDKLIAARALSEQKTGANRLQITYLERQVKKARLMIKGVLNA